MTGSGFRLDAVVVVLDAEVAEVTLRQDVAMRQVQLAGSGVVSLRWPFLYHALQRDLADRVLKLCIHRRGHHQQM